MIESNMKSTRQNLAGKTIKRCFVFEKPRYIKFCACFYMVYNTAHRLLDFGRAIAYAVGNEMTLAITKCQ